MKYRLDLDAGDASAGLVAGEKQEKWRGGGEASSPGQRKKTPSRNWAFISVALNALLPIVPTIGTPDTMAILA